MNDREQFVRWAPQWAHTISAPMWVSDPDRNLCEINRKAEELLDLNAEECLCKKCFEVVASVDTFGRPFCRKTCPIRRKTSRGQRMEVYHVESPGQGKRAVPFHLLPIPVNGPDGRDQWIVHWAIEADPCRRLHQYLARVAHRPSLLASDLMQDDRPLTPREIQILELMIEDHDMDQIARDLHVSYHTIRNHVQHILPKLSAHSIQQAVAIYLLQEHKTRR